MKAQIALTLSNAVMPTRAHGGEDAGWDVYSAASVVAPHGVWVKIPTGLIIAPEPGWWFELVGRSSAHIKGIDVQRGIIDNGYRGELYVFARSNAGSGTRLNVRQGDRLAQIIFHRIVNTEWEVVLRSELSDSSRGDRGFGSSGGAVAGH